MSARLSVALDYSVMVESDLDEVAATESELYEFPWSRSNFEDSLGAGYSAWRCSHRGKTVGYGVMLLVLDEAHLLNLSIRTQWQGRGYGRALLEFLSDQARRHGARSLFLEVRPTNRAALALYQRCGFSEIGRRRGYYPARNGREDAVVMRCDL